MDKTIIADTENEMRRLISAAQEQNILLRLLGGLAFKVRCQASQLAALKRDYPDIDLATDKAGGWKLGDFFVQMGYSPNKTFNTLNGNRRQLYYDETHNRQVDIFVGDFEMCHKIPLSSRLALDKVTLPLAELFLTKAQIVELNAKDARDLFTLLLDHEVVQNDVDGINAQIIVGLCAKDWGFYTTIQDTLCKLGDILDNGKFEFNQSQIDVIKQRMQGIAHAIDQVDKSFAWKARSKIGKRMRWYEEVEEVHR